MLTISSLTFIEDDEPDAVPRLSKNAAMIT